MSLKGCFACIKYLVIIFNLLLWGMGYAVVESSRRGLEAVREGGDKLTACILFTVINTLAGIGVLAVSIWLYVDSINYLKGPPDSYMYFTAVYILMGAGGVMTVVGFLGCCGALRESQCMLGTYFVLLLVIFAAELTGGIWAFLHKDELKDWVTKHVTTMVKDQYKHDSAAQKTIDALQHDLHCCGSVGPRDWASNSEIGVSTSLAETFGTYEVPASCCKVEDKVFCETVRHIALGATMTGSIYTQGCVERLQEYIEQHLNVIFGVAIGIAVAQILALVFSIFLCCGLREPGSHSYKA